MFGNGEEIFDVGKLLLGELLMLKGKEGSTELSSVLVPTSWKQLINLYQKLGMSAAQGGEYVYDPMIVSMKRIYCLHMKRM